MYYIYINTHEYMQSTTWMTFNIYKLYLDKLVKTVLNRMR